MPQGIPTVPQGKARIRDMISAAHSQPDLDMGLAALSQVGKKLGVI
jgi:glycine C-acetyltransferase